MSASVAPDRRALRSPAARPGFIASVLLGLCASAVGWGQGPAPIVIDGSLDEWTQRPTLLIDPADAPDAVIDIGRVAVDDDPQWLHFLVDLRRPVTLQQLDGRLMLLLDADDDESTGANEHGMAGVDLVVTFTPPNRNRPDRPGMGVGVEWIRDGERIAVSPYAFELTFAPTTESPTFEIRMMRVPDAIERPALGGRGLRGRWVFLDRDGVLRDETDVFAYRYATAAAPYAAPNPTADPLARASGTAARVVSWNVEFGALFENPGPFARVLRALQPDVLLLQELPPDSAERLHEWLTVNLPGRSWSVTVGAGGGNLRTGVASALAMGEISALETVGYERDGRPRDVRTAAAMVDVGGVPTLFMSIHLKCCGRAHGPEDMQRIEEVTAIRDALREAIGLGSPVVVGGDYNLVGSREPMRPLTVEWGLAKADLPSLDGRGVATWFDPNSPFTPGRLDYVLFCNASLRVLNGFVFDTHQVGPRWTQRHGLESDDVRSASDHFPLVLDVAPRTASRDGQGVRRDPIRGESRGAR